MSLGNLLRGKIPDETTETKVIKVLCFHFKVTQFTKMSPSVFLKSYFSTRCDNKSYRIK